MFSSPSNQRIISDFAYNHRFAILGIVLIDSVMANLDSSMVNIVLPTITTAYNTDLSDTQWVITAYLLSMTCLFIFFGKLSEFTGVCKLFTTGSVLFTMSSLACGLSADLNQLIFFRVLQGIGSSMVAGISIVIIFRVFPSYEIGRALGYSGSIVSICGMSGPALGGIINDILGWQYIFFINVPIGIFLFVCNLKYLKIPEDYSTRLEIDWIGALTLILTVVFFSLSCEEISSHLHITTNAYLYGLIFITSGIIFVIQEKRCDHPLLDLSIFKNYKYNIPVASNFLLTIANFSLITLIPFYFEGVMGMTAFEIGIVFMVNSIVQIFASGTTGWVIDQYRWKYLAGFGLFVVTVTAFLMGYALITINFALILAMFILRTIGASLFLGQKNIEVMNALPEEKAATASSVSTTISCLGASVGVSTASLLVTLQINSAGYHGPILSAGTDLLSRSIGLVIVFTACICLIVACASIIRNMDIHFTKRGYR